MIRQTFKEIALLLCLSLVVTASTYALRNDAPSLFATQPTDVLQPPKAMPTAPVPLTAEQAYDAFINQQALFVDGRDAFDYDMGHIPGAVNIPLHEALADPAVLDVLPQNRRLVVYCSNDLCDKAAKLAAMLTRQGRHADTFPGGLQTWAEYGWPTEGQQ